MIDRDEVLFVHGVSAEQWAARLGIELFTKTCDRCGAKQTTTRPFAVGRLRGLMAPECCGEHPPYCVVATDGDLFDALKAHSDALKWRARA